jgi:hypothetical protein
MHELTLATDFATDRMEALLSELRESGFRPYVTSVGGAGLGILSEAVDMAPGADIPPAFHAVQAEGLESWAEQAGQWLYI